MAQLKLVNFAKVLKKAQEPGNDLTDCSPDVNFKVYKEDGVLAGSIKAHKFLLSLISPVFRNQFYGSLASTHQEKEEVEIKDCSYVVFKLMLKLIYDDTMDPYEKHIQNSLDVGLLFELLQLADKYQIEGLAVLVKNRIATVPVSAQNAVEFLEITEQYKDLLNFDDICKNLSHRIFNTMFGTWRYSTDVLNFWFNNQDKAETVDILFEKCFSMASKGLFAIENKNSPTNTIYRLKNVDYCNLQDFEGDTFLDVEFHVLDKKGQVEKIRGHKLLLALVSPVFKQEFYGSPSDNVDGEKVLIVKVKEEFSAEVFKIMIKFIYESKGNSMKAELCKKNTENLFMLLNISDRYLLPELSEMVITVIREIPVTSANAIEVLAITKKFEDQPRVSSTCTDLKKRLVETMAVNLLRTPVDVLKFWSENKDNKDLVCDLFAYCVERNTPALQAYPYNNGRW